MPTVVSILAILFGVLHIIAACTQLKSKEPAARGFAIAMLCGGVCAAFEAFAHLVGSSPGWIDALGVAAGCLLICAAAYGNGRRSGNLHLSHHMVRGAAAVLLIISFFIW